MNCQNCGHHVNDGMGAGLTFLATCFGMVMMAFAFIGGCSVVFGDREPKHQQVETYYDQREGVY